MCLTKREKGKGHLLKLRHSNFKIAQKDIKVFKVLKVLRSKNNTEAYVSPFKGAKYSLGERKKSKLQKQVYVSRIEDECIIKVYVGLHAYITRRKAKSMLVFRDIIVEMIIPKGARYIVEDNHIASSL